MTELSIQLHCVHSVRQT